MRGDSKTILIFAAAMLLLGGVAMADTLTVNNAAAMGGTGTACGGGNCGLQDDHDNSSRAFVEDTTPEAEAIYRATWLFNANEVNTANNFRQTIFSAVSDNPNPNVGLCPGAAFVSAFRVFQYNTGGSGQNPSVQAFVRGNQCGDRATSRIDITEGTPARVCVEWGAAGSGNGFISLAVVDAASACPPTGDAAYSTNTLSNQLTNVQQVRLGTPETNNFAAGETAVYYFDEFESFRTTAGPGV